MIKIYAADTIISQKKAGISMKLFIIPPKNGIAYNLFGFAIRGSEITGYIHYKY